MSSFRHSHYVYLFSLKGGDKKRMAYGRNPEDALEVLAFRMTPEEMERVDRDDFIKIRQQDMPKYVHLLA